MNYLEKILFSHSSPSGCTFWGKKPWSRKKKILWQMGTLIGAPLGIALAAGVVLPAMVIGIPVYVGRQVRAFLLAVRVTVRDLSFTVKFCVHIYTIHLILTEIPLIMRKQVE